MFLPSRNDRNITGEHIETGGQMKFSILFALPFVSIATNVAAAAERPNVVFIISDDQAYGDYGFMGNRLVHTPNLDVLAARSARYVNGYVPSSVCRPSLAKTRTLNVVVSSSTSGLL